MQNIVLDNIKFPTGKEKDEARFRQIQEERLNRNFRRLLENDANKNSATALPDSIRVGDNIDIYKPTVHHGAVLEQFGSTVASHSAAGNYAKILTFGTDVTVGKNLAPTNAWNTGRRWWGSNINSAGLLGSVLETLPVGTYTISWKYTLTAIPSDTTTTLQVGKYVRVKYGGSYHVLSSYALTTIPTYAVGDTYSVQATITIDSAAVGQAFEVLGYCGQADSFYATLTEYQIEVGSQKTSFEPYIDVSNLNINAPITLEYVKTGDVSPTTLTIVFNRDYTLQSFTKDASADAYLVNSTAAHWDLYIGKSNSSDSVEILDFHNPWSNSDMTIDWEDTSISTLPTGYVSASLASIPNNIGDLIDTGKRIYEYPANINLASGTPKTTVSITLPKGIWLLMGTVQFNSNSSGIRTVYFATSSDSSTDMGAVYKDLRPAVNGGQTYCRITAYYTNSSSSTTLYLIASQNSGSTISTAGRIMAVKIA